MAAADEVRQASDRFYAALNRMLNGDAPPSGLTRAPMCLPRMCLHGYSGS